MTKIDATRGTVTPTGVTHLPDLLLRELWLAYADALGPFDACKPDDTSEEYHPGITDELGVAHHALRAVRQFIGQVRDHSEYSRAVQQWLRAVDAARGWHGIRQAFLYRIANATMIPLAALSAEPLMRARVDDAMVRLEGGDKVHYNDCYQHVLGDLASMFGASHMLALRSHVASLIGA